MINHKSTTQGWLQKTPHGILFDDFLKAFKQVSNEPRGLYNAYFKNSIPLFLWVPFVVCPKAVKHSLQQIENIYI